jgi:hypothetical protein
MSQTITQWISDIGHAAYEKFPANSNMSVYDRLDSIQRQLDDVICSIRVERGDLQSNDHAHQDPDHRIAALIADILILAYDRNTDVEGELHNVHKWFLDVGN